VLVRDAESSHLALESDGQGEDVLQDLQGHSIKYSIAAGRRPRRSGPHSMMFR
jgi:hypothetical protein